MICEVKRLLLCEMAFLGLYLSYIILVLLLVIYFKLVYKCKRGVEVSVDIIRKTEDGWKNSKVDVLPQPPGPVPWPILGNLALLGQYKSPFEGFTALSKIYGGVYSLTLGTTRCVVLSDLNIIKEMLNQNGKYFGGRPNFEVS